MSKSKGAVNVLALDRWNYGALGDGATDDTDAIQTAIDALAAAGGGTIYFPFEGPYMTRGIALRGTANGPGNVSLEGTGGTILRATSAAATVLDIEPDISRDGPRVVRKIKIDGNSVAGVVGIKTGSTVSACLHVYLQQLDVRGCATGIDLYSAMEHHLEDVVCFSNTVGMKLRSDPTNGGGNSNTFTRVAFQQNTVGLFYHGASALSMQNNCFTSCLFQSNTLCAVAGFSAEGDWVIDNSHFEGNGVSGTSAIVEGQTIPQCSVYLSGATLELRSCGISEASANPCIKLASSAVIKLRDSGGYGLTSGTFVDGTLSETVEFYGKCSLAGRIKAHIGRWPDTVDVANLARWSGSGQVVVTPSPLAANDYAASTPSVPLLQNAVDATINADAGDAEMGMVSNATFTAAIGNTGANRVTINALPTGVTNGDKWIISFLVKADKACDMTFVVTSGSFDDYTGPVNTKWRRVVLMFGAGSSNTPLLYCYTASTDAPTVYFAKLMAHRVASGGDLYKLNEILALGLFNNNQNEFYYTAAPTVGTWKRGDRVWNTAPSAGGAPGWVCTTAGTPGTWKAMANLAP